MKEFTKDEISFLESLEEARIATSHEDMPHVKPVSYLQHENAIIVATDYNTRTFENIKSNPRTAIVIDVYKSGGHKAVSIQGITEIIEKGAEFKKFYDMFFQKFEWVRKEPWEENEAPFLKIIPKNIKSWGLS